MPDDPTNTNGGEGATNGGEGDNKPKGETPPPDDKGGEGEPESFSRDYVEELRKENAKWRTQFREVETELDEIKKAQMSEQEKAIEEAKTQARQEVEAQYKERLAREKVKAQAAGEFNDPEDALRYLDLDELDIDDDYAIGEALLKILEEKPYLAKTEPKRRSIDQGPQGRTVDPKSSEDWVRGALRPGRR